MAKTMKRLLCAVLTLAMCMSMLCVPAMAAQTVNGNTWYGDELAVKVTAGTEGYTFMSLFRKPAHGYEFSGHFLGDGEGPQTFVVIDTVEHDGTTWKPSGIYDPMNSNYEVTYCCDVETMIVDGTYYKRLNLEDSEYYSEAEAAKIRSIVTNAYPYVSLEAMKADLAKNGYAYADALTRNEALAAVQAAIWASANEVTAENLRYQKSYKVSDNLQWGYPLHDTSVESGLDVSGKRVFKTYEEVGERINSLVDYLLAQKATYADKAAVVITKLEMEGDPLLVDANTAEVKLNLELNNSGSGYQDAIKITIYSGEKVIKEIPVTKGTEKYSVNVQVDRNAKITAVVSGTQVLPKGVYFYAPKAEDVNGDGVATGREVSQNLVGVAMGETPVYAKAELELEGVDIPEPPVVSFESGKASNISFMLIDKETGEVEFLEKIDIGGQTSFDIPAEPGKISAVFIKQSTSGMFWTSEKVSEEVLNNVIECLKDNNPSYKGHNAVAYGMGDHELEFKKNKFATYTFASRIAVEADDVVSNDAASNAVVEEKAEATVTETPVVETEPPATEAPVVDHGKTHLLGDAEGDLKTFNFKVDNKYIPEAGEERYAVVGGGEQTEFWTAYMFNTAADGETAIMVGNQALYSRGDGRNINGIYLDGKFYPSSDLEYPGKAEGKNLQAAYNGLQQALLMNGNGKKVAVYCADHVTPTTTAARYNVVNIEDAEHYDEETASKIRAIAVNGYWGGTEEIDQYGTLAKMKAMMRASGKFTEAEIALLSPGVALSATQFAIWELANEYDDRQVVNVQYIVKNRVAGYNGKTWNTLKLTPEAEIPCVDLIFKLSHYLTTLKPIPASAMSTANTVLNYNNILQDVEIEVVKKAAGHENNTDDNKDNDAYVTNVTFDILKVSEKDKLVAKVVDAKGKVYAIGRIAGEKQEGEVALVKNSNGTYTFPGITLIENAETTYTVVVEGVQYLERNVYLYFAGERETSQTLIGYDEGEFKVDVESSIKETFNVDEPETPPTVSFKSGEASNISFMLIDAEGNVEFVKKYDIGKETSFEIPTEPGKISAVFVKQSTSGMFWISQEVDEAVVDAVIECLKANNPSYKGYNAVAFGEGEHDLEFKKGKFVTYTFTGEFFSVNVETAEEIVVEEPVTEETVVEETVTEETVVEETVTEETVVEESVTEEPVIDETVVDEPEVEEEPTLDVTVKGADVESWTIVDDVTAIYIAANGKVPAVIWTSEEVDEDTLAALIDELGADADARVISGLGKHKIEYNHNKNKTKTVTYTFG